jgi:hypothetical protein
MAEPNGGAPRPGTPGTASGGIGQAWRDALQAHARYYEAWGQLASTWLRDLADASKEARLPSLSSLSALSGLPSLSGLPGLPPLRVSTTPGPGGSGAAASSGGSSSSGAAVSAEAPAAPAVLVLEGATGDVAVAAFLVENSLPHLVDGTVEAEPFEDPDGAAVLARLEFEPTLISLAPGERRLVRVSVQLPPSLPANVECTSTIRVQGVPGTTIPIRLRRIAD